MKAGLMILGITVFLVVNLKPKEENYYKIILL